LSRGSSSRSLDAQSLSDCSQDCFMLQSFSQSYKYPFPRFGKTSASPKSDAGFQIWNREKLPLRPGVGTIRIRKPAIRRKYEQGFLEPVEHVDFVGDESHSS